MLSLFECITHSLSLSIEELKLFAIVNWILHVSKRLRLFMVPFKYNLILLRYSSSDSVYFYHHYFCIQYNCYSQNYLPMLKKILNFFKYSVFNWFSSFISSLRRFLVSLIMFSSSRLNVFHHYMFWKKIITKNKNLLYSLRKHLKMLSLR